MLSKAARLGLVSVCLTAFAPAFAPAFADDEYILPPIVKETSPVEFLDQDPVVPAREADVNTSTGNGSLVQSFEDKLPFAVTDPGRPGGLNQFRGLGISAEETNVQALGIPLNYAQGGGFDFSTFPQFFWSSFKFRETPSFSALDPRGVAGTISLVPWTASALDEPLESSDQKGDQHCQNCWKTRWSALYSDADLVQLSVAGKYQDRVAILAGTSSGQVNGPSGSLSAKVYDSDSLKVKFHFLATDVNETLYNFGTTQPNETEVVRMIPVGEIDAVPGADWALKSSVFYDNTYLRSDTYSDSFFTRDRAQQGGAENALVYEDWKLGMGVRHIAYAINGVFVPDETITHASFSRTVNVAPSRDSHFIVDPVLEEVSDSGFSGPYPSGSLGLRQEWGQGDLAVFARGTYSRRFPSLADRYYTAFGAAANPALQPEQDITSIVGVEGKQGIWSGSVQGFYQLRDNAQAPVILSDGFTTEQENEGKARVASLQLDGSVDLSAHAKFSDSFTWNRSHSDGLNARFPLLPDLINVATLRFVPAERWSVDLIGRAQSDAFSSPFTPNSPLPAAAFGDIQVAYDWTPSLRLIGRAENFTGESLVLYPGYPPEGRVISVAAVGQL